RRSSVLRARRAPDVARPAAWDGAVRAGARSRGRARARGAHDHAPRQPGGPLRRPGADPRRGPGRCARRSCGGADAGDRRARVFLAGRHRAVRGSPADDPPTQEGGPSMRVLGCSLPPILLPVLLAGQQPADTVELNPVVVTATRLPRSATGVPAAVTVLRGVELRAQGIHTVFEALRDVPGAAVVQTGSFGGQT